MRNNNTIGGLGVAVLAVSALCMSPAHAGGHQAVKGYLTDSSGAIVTDGSGGCWKTGSWTPADAIAECGGGMKSSAMADADGDGVADGADNCPDTPKGMSVAADGCPADADGDGVADAYDRCPGTPLGMVVDALGCLPDADGDGVADGADRCPNTAAGAVIDAFGCAEKAVLSAAAGDVSFAFGSAKLNTGATSKLDNVMDRFNSDHDIAGLEVVGHTDSVGPADYNMELSLERARSVRDYLDRHGIAPHRMDVQGMGETKPVADNATAAGRAQNRRVEIYFKR